MTEGQWDDGQQDPSYTGCILETRGRGRERIVLLVKCIRCCVRKEEGSGGESIYIYDPSADLGAVRHTTRHTSENHCYKPQLQPHIIPPPIPEN